MWLTEATDTSKPGTWFWIALGFIIICAFALIGGGRND